MHLSGHDSIQKVHTGLAKNVHLSGLCTYAVCTYPVLDHVQNIVQNFGAWKICALILFVHLSGFDCIRLTFVYDGKSLKGFVISTG